MIDELSSLAIAVGLSAFVLTGLVRKMVLRYGVLDHPSDRSSHAVATPRGGGIGVVLPVLVVGAVLAAHAASWTLSAVFLAVGAVAVVGWIDDRNGLPVRRRLAVHMIAAVAVGAMACAESTTVAVALVLFVWWSFWAVSSINLVNFMDGINGLVAFQMVVFALSLALFPSDDGAGRAFETSVAAACLGFLPWNFPRARIFLGDVGSGALGFLVPVLAVLALNAQGVDIIRIHLPLLPLFGDATWTIFRRWRNGERLTQPHRSHLYQRLANGGWGHATVTLIYTAAAILGAAAVHLGPETWLSLWTLGYVSLTLLVGVLLHRRTTRAPSAVG